MGGWNNEVGGNLWMKNDRGGWNKQVGGLFPQNQYIGWVECFP